MDEQYIVETYEDEPSGPFCPDCGADLDWEECDQCGGDGYLDWERLQEEDPLWFQPGDTEPCTECDGKGGWWLCGNGQCGGKVAE